MFSTNLREKGKIHRILLSRVYFSPGRIISFTWLKKYHTLFSLSLLWLLSWFVGILLYSSIMLWFFFSILVMLHHSCMLQCSVQHHIRTTCISIYLFIYLVPPENTVTFWFDRAALSFIRWVWVNSLSVQCRLWMSQFMESTLLLESRFG